MEIESRSGGWVWVLCQSRPGNLRPRHQTLTAGLSNIWVKVAKVVMLIHFYKSKPTHNCQLPYLDQGQDQYLNLKYYWVLRCWRKLKLNEHCSTESSGVWYQLVSLHHHLTFYNCLEQCCNHQPSAHHMFNQSRVSLIFE